MNCIQYTKYSLYSTGLSNKLAQLFYYFKTSLRESLANRSINCSGSIVAVIFLLNAKITRRDNLSKSIETRWGRSMCVKVEKKDSTRAVEIGNEVLYQ